MNIVPISISFSTFYTVTMIFDSGLSYVFYANLQCLHLAYYHVNDENINSRLPEQPSRMIFSSLTILLALLSVFTLTFEIKGTLPTFSNAGVYLNVD